MKLIFTFEEISDSIRSEAALREIGVACAPRSLGVSCAYIIRVDTDAIDRVFAALQGLYAKAFSQTENGAYEPCEPFGYPRARE
jgi:hypothetical protein